MIASSRKYIVSCGFVHIVCFEWMFDLVKHVILPNLLSVPDSHADVVPTYYMSLITIDGPYDVDNDVIVRVRLVYAKCKLATLLITSSLFPRFDTEVRIKQTHPWYSR